MKIVTSGLTFLDIDAYAGCVAYAELLNLQGFEAVPFSSATFNESIPQLIRDLGAPFSTDYTPLNDDSFVLIDVSEPDFIEKTVVLERVEEVIDHHVGYEDFWAERIGDKAEIEFIGAACTLVFERWKALGLLNKMSETSARLLVAGILDNTLNFKALVTTERDKTAYAKLLSIANISDDWAALYFQACESAIYDDIATSVVNDMKVMSFEHLTIKNIAVGQLVVWDGLGLIQDHFNLIAQTLSQTKNDWFMNVVSIGEGKSYFIASSPAVQEWLGQVFKAEFNDKIAPMDRLWLRKEIVKKDLNL